MRPSLLALGVLAMALVASPAAAQVDECGSYIRLIDALVEGTDPQAAMKLTDVGQTARCFAEFLAVQGSPGGESVFRNFVRRFQGSRTDRQAGTTTAGAGTTTVVAQGPVARVLSVASEYGALTQSSNKGIVTLRGNLAGLPSALLSHDVFPYCIESDTVSAFCVNGSLLSVLRKVSFGVSFDPSRQATLTATPTTPAGGPSQQVTFTASQREITGISLRAELLNRRDTTSAEFRDTWKAAIATGLDQAATDLMSAGTFFEDVMELPIYDEWRTRSRRAIETAGRDRGQIVRATTQALQELTAAVRAMPDYQTRLAAMQGAYNRLFQRQDEVIDAVATANVLAVEYTLARPASQPSTSNYRVIYDQPLSRKTKVVANAALTHYVDTPADAAAGGRIRDAQIGVQLDRGLGDTAIGAAVVSVAGYFQYQRAASIFTIDPANPLPGVTVTGLPDGATEVFTKTGHIWLAQAKLTLTPATSSVTVPVSFTYSNRTELVDKSTWRGQIGLSYNVDALLAAVRR